MELSTRKAIILKLIVDRYAVTGEPVGSKTICEDVSLSLSSATIRNEMAALTQMGLIEQPHTSSGRVPTEEGYRIYVHRLMKPRALSQTDQKRIEAAFPYRIESPDALLDRAGKLLSELTQCAVIATTPSDSQSVVTRVELIPVSGNVCLLVLMTSSGTIRNRMCRLEESMSAQQLSDFSKMASSVLAGLPLAQIGTGAIQTLAAAVGIDAISLTGAINELYELIEDSCKTTLCTNGEIRLLTNGIFPPHSLGAAIQLLSDREAMAQLLNDRASGTVIRIGSDLPYETLRHTALISTDYSFAGKGGGRIGIIGPIQLNYPRMIPYVEYIASMVDNILNDSISNRRISYVKR